jgi:hypothetical protein
MLPMSMTTASRLCGARTTFDRHGKAEAACTHQVRVERHICYTKVLTSSSKAASFKGISIHLTARMSNAGPPSSGWLRLERSGTGVRVICLFIHSNHYENLT